MNALPHQEFTHQIIGISYKVYNKLGFGYHEKHYQRSFAEELNNLNIVYEREKKFIIKYDEVDIGRYFVDFEINKNLVVELKVAQEFHQRHINQVLAYLKSSKIKLGLLILFTKTGVKVKRLII
ncbi:MAG: GxxExxY protein [Parcubacteria group bacterium]|nr:GxxExxY protein [Parcubacteria group bacterium]